MPGRTLPHRPFALALCASALLFAPGAYAAARLERVSLTASAGETSLQLALKGSVRPRSYLLASPRRLVIDLPATTKHLAAPLPTLQTPIASLRLGVQAHGMLRVVIGLADGAQARLLPAASNDPLLVVQLRRSSAASAASAPASSGSVARSLTAAPPAAKNVVAAHAPAEEGRDIVIAVDAGHGGDDPGASGKSGTQEKAVTLAIARRLAQRIGQESGLRAVLTRDSDVFVPLRERAARARRAGADLFVSVHADAVRDREVDGASVYVLSERGASSEAAHILADRENAADLRGVPLSGKPDVLASVLVNLSQSAALGSSVEAAGNVLGTLDEVGAIRKREVQYAGFAVLKSPDMPSMLVETAYISNPGEEAKLRDVAYQTRLADAIASGVLKYFRSHPPDGSRLALERRRADAAALRIARNR